MSTNIIVLNNGVQLFVNTDLSKIFVFGNEYIYAPYNNSAYDAVTLQAGTVMGRVSATGWIKPLVSSASDGSQYPVGILADDFTIAGGALVDLPICIKGDVISDKLVFSSSSDNLDTTISSRRIRDRIASDTSGIRLVPSTEMTAPDNY